MKINIDWFVLHPFPNNYNCSRWCYTCISGNHKTSIPHEIDLKFLVKFSQFIKKNNIKYHSISLNQCGDLMTNQVFIKKYLYTLLKLGILHSWNELLLYTKITSLEKKFTATLEENIGRFRKNFHLSVWVSMRLDRSFFERDIYEKIRIFQKNNLHTKVILHRDIQSSLNTHEKWLILNELNFLLDKGILLCWSEEEGNKFLTKHDLIDDLFHYWWEKKCMFLKKNYLNFSNDRTDIFMFDFSKAQIIPHGPYCSSVKNLSIWNINMNMEVLVKNAKQLQNSLKSMTQDYVTQWSQWNICTFCQLYFINKTQHAKDPSS